jgi:hypothetical protein
MIAGKMIAGKMIAGKIDCRNYECSEAIRQFGFDITEVAAMLEVAAIDLRPCVTGSPQIF